MHHHNDKPASVPLCAYGVCVFGGGRWVLTQELQEFAFWLRERGCVLAG